MKRIFRVTWLPEGCDHKGMSIISLVITPRESSLFSTWGTKNVPIQKLSLTVHCVACVCDLRLGCVWGTSSATCGWSAWLPPPQWCTPAALLPATPPAADSSWCPRSGMTAYWQTQFRHLKLISKYKSLQQYSQYQIFNIWYWEYCSVYTSEYWTLFSAVMFL